MKPQKLHTAFISVIVLAILSSCAKEHATPKPANPVPLPPLSSGLYVLLQGSYDTGIILPTDTAYKSSLGYYNFVAKTEIPDQFKVANGSAVGLNASDMEIYGSKMYIAVGTTGVVDIADVKTTRLLKRDSLPNPTFKAPFGQPYFSPSYVAFYQGQAIVSATIGMKSEIVVIDTSTLAIVNTIPVNGFLGGLAVANHKLYVAVEAPLSDSIDVLDLASWAFIRSVKVLVNPVNVAADSFGNIYVLSGFEDFFTGATTIFSPGGIDIIDSRSDKVTFEKAETIALDIAFSGDFAYYVTNLKNINILNARTQTPVYTNFITNGNTISIASAITVNSATGEIFVADAKPYFISPATIYAFDKNGKLEYNFTTGVSPVKLAVQNQ